MNKLGASFLKPYEEDGLRTTHYIISCKTIGVIALISTVFGVYGFLQKHYIVFYSLFI